METIHVGVDIGTHCREGPFMCRGFCMPRKVVCFVLVLMAFLASQAGADGFLPPVAMVRKIPSGAPSSMVWKLPVAIPRFEHFQFDYVPTQQTEVRLAYDDNNLYVAFKCLEEQMGKVQATKTKRDDEVWKEDSAWVMVDPTLSRKTYFNMVANVIGTMFDEKDHRETPKSWDAQWSVVTSRGTDSWTALFSIPFKSLGVATPKPGTKWGANPSRLCTPAHERSCWTTVRRHLRDPQLWGYWVFGGSSAPVISVIQEPVGRSRELSPCGLRAGGNCSEPRTPIGAPGKYPLRLAVSNPTTKPAKLVAQVVIDDRVVAKQTKVVPPGASVWKTQFTFPYEGEHGLKFAVVDQASGQVVMRTSRQYVYIRKHRARIKALGQMVAELTPDTANGKSEKAAVTKQLASVTALAARSEGDFRKWDELGIEVRKAAKAVGRLRAMCADSAGLGYALGTECAINKVFRDEMFPGKFGAPVSLSAARNEYESAQAVVIAYDKPLEKVQVSVSSLAGPNGAVIPADQVKLNLVDWVRTGNPRYAVDYIGWTPDPLIDLAPFDVPIGGLRPIWLTVHPSVDAPAGTYKGALTFAPANAPESKIAIELKVWDFALPTKMALKTAFAFATGELNMWYGDCNQQMKRDWYAFLLEHHINPTNIYSKEPKPDFEDMQFCVDRGLNAFTLHCTWGKEGEGLRQFLETLKGEEEWLKARGWWDMAYIYGFDELGPDRYAELNSTYGAIKKAFPDLKTMTTIVPNKFLKGSVDIWVPLTPDWNPEDAEAYTRDGDDVWWYVCCHPFHPYPNYFIDYPAIDPRILSWMNWKCKVPGILYYMTNLWECNRDPESMADYVRSLHNADPVALAAIKAGKKWPDVPWNTYSCASFQGDGQILYPGPNGKPLSCMRLEGIRDGIEDYEYFNQLNLLVEKRPNAPKSVLDKARKLLKVRDDVVKSSSEYTLDPELLLAARRELAETIEALGK